MWGVILTELLMFDEVFYLFQEERKKGDLKQLPREFYKSTQEYINKLEKTTENRDEEDKKISNFKKIISGLKERRRQKILIYLAYNRSLPEKIPFEEEQLYIKLKNTLNENGANEPKFLKLKINSNMPEIITPKGNKMGPFNQNQIVEVSNDTDLEFLIKNKVGELIQT